MDFKMVFNIMLLVFFSLIIWKGIFLFWDSLLNGHKKRKMGGGSDEDSHKCYKFSVHAAIFDADNKVLLLKQSYGDKRWGLPGGGVEPGETVHEAIKRECREELGTEVEIESFTGLYYHKEFNSQVGIFRCKIKENTQIRLSEEHTEYTYKSIEELGEVQRIRVQNALEIDSVIASQAF